jgi:hypothetical protein
MIFGWRRIFCMWKGFWFISSYCPMQCSKTWIGPAGRPGTQPTRAWNRSRWRQKPGQTRLRPGLFFFILIDVKRRRFGLCFKCQNDEEQWSRIGHIDHIANLINKKINFNRWGAEESRRRLDHCCFTAKKVRLLFLFTNLLLSLSLFFILGRVLNLQFWHHFGVRWFSRIDSFATQSSQPQVCFSVLSFLQRNKSSAIRKCRKWMRKLVLFDAFAFGTVIARDWNYFVLITVIARDWNCCKNYWLWLKYFG